MVELFSCKKLKKCTDIVNMFKINNKKNKKISDVN